MSCSAQARPESDQRGVEVPIFHAAASATSTHSYVMPRFVRLLLALVFSLGSSTLAFGRDVSFSIELKSRLAVFGILRGESKFTIDKGEEGVIGSPDFTSVGSAELRLGPTWILLPQCVVRFIQSSNEQDVDISVVSNLMLREPKPSSLRFVFRPGADVVPGNELTTEMLFSTEPLQLTSLKVRRLGESEAVLVPLPSVCADMERRLMLPRPL